MLVVNARRRIPRILQTLVVVSCLVVSYVIFMPLMYSLTLGVSVSEAASDLISYPKGFVQGGMTLTPAAFLSAILAGFVIWVTVKIIWLFSPEWRFMPAPRREEGDRWRVRESAGVAALCCTFSIAFGFVGIYFLQGAFGSSFAARWLASALLFFLALLLSRLAAHILFGRVAENPD